LLVKLLQFLFRQLLMGDIHQEAAHPGASGHGIANHLEIGCTPYHSVVPGNPSEELFVVRVSVELPREQCAVVHQHLIPVLRMNATQPEIRCREPFGRRIAKHLLHIAAYEMALLHCGLLEYERRHAIQDVREPLALRRQFFGQLPGFLLVVHRLLFRNTPFRNFLR